jgi:translation initiation factor IF-2
LPVRIYSLAKELKLDSKILVDICTNAGVTGKGSALASLTDEEVERVKAFIAGGQGASRPAPVRPRPITVVTSTPPPVAASAAPPAAPPVEAPVESTALRREDYIAPAGTSADKMPVLGDRSKKKKTPTAPPAPRRRAPAPRSSWHRFPRSRNRWLRPRRPKWRRKSPTCGCRSTPLRRPAALAAPSR